MKTSTPLANGKTGFGAPLERALGALEALSEAGEPFGGLFPSILEPDDATRLESVPPLLKGQRVEDRAWRGSNLMHDEASLAALYGLAEALGRPSLAAAADRYLKRFATHCLVSENGLFPWGEHSFWRLDEDRMGNGYMDTPEGAERFKSHHLTHDHLRSAPLWLWRKLHSFNPACAARFAKGLDWHWMEGLDEYNRHAHMREPVRYVKAKGRSCDFPRHSGFYVFDSAFAFSISGEAALKEQALKFLDYWWLKRDSRGLCLIESRVDEGDALGHCGSNAPFQTLSLALSVLEAAALLEPSEPPLSAEMRSRATVYLEGFLSAPHEPSKGVLSLLCKRSDNSLSRAMPLWASFYGSAPAASCALLCLRAFALTGDSRLFAFAADSAKAYEAAGVPADGSPLMAIDAGACLGLFAELYAISKERRWLDSGLAFASELSPRLFKGRLPRAAAGCAWYDSQCGPGFLLHSLARLGLFAEGFEKNPLEADFTMR